MGVEGAFKNVGIKIPNCFLHIFQLLNKNKMSKNKYRNLLQHKASVNLNTIHVGGNRLHGKKWKYVGLHSQSNRRKKGDKL